MGEQARGPESPRLSANFLSRVFFWWLTPLFYDGKSRDLKNNDLHDPLPEDVSEQLGTRLEKYWRNEVEDARRDNRKPKLVEAIRKAFGLRYFYYAGPMIILSCFKVFQPLMLGLLIQSLQSDSESRGRAYVYACSLIFLTFFHSLLKHHIDLATLAIGMRLRIACSSLIYRKSIKLSNASVGASTGGQIINLLSNDAVRFDPLFTYLHYIWISPLQGILVAYLIWRSVGVAAFVGIFFMMIGTIPVQVYIGKITSRLRGKIATKTDERVRLMSEIINGIHVIKMYTWEKPFQSLVSLARRYEIDVITSMSYLRGINISTSAFTDRTCLFFTIMVYTLAGNFITADKAFSMVQYFTILQVLLAYNYPRAMFNAAEARVSIKRIEKFLMLEEIKIKAPLLSVEDNARITLKNITACWMPNSIVNTLHDISINITPKKLHAVIGPVGSGKSSLLQVILGELRISAGDLKINGTTSYASQRPWLFPGTIRENIIFDQLYDDTRYHQVLKVCALERDLERLPRGDKTQVGERGTSLSGGQCSRINLARAVYRDADIYVFDDPFSAVDANVCKCLFNDCINGYLKDKTRIFVTHQAQCLKEADMIFLLNNGKLESQGQFKDFPKKELQSLNIINEEEVETVINEAEIVGIMNNKNTDNNILSKPLIINKVDESPETEELIAKGKMKNSIFLRYFSSGNSNFLLVTTFLCFLMAQSIRCGSDYWLGYWTNQEEAYLNLDKKIEKLNESRTTETPLLETTTSLISTSSIPSTTQTVIAATVMNLLPNTTEKLRSNLIFNSTNAGQKNTLVSHMDLDVALIIYGCLLFACIVVTVSKALLFYKICMRSSVSIHDEMFSCVLKAPMRFFNKQTSGQILNRFSKDTGTMDEILPVTMYEAIEIFSVTLGIVFFQLIIINWWSILPIILTAFLYWKIKNFYVPTAYGIKRLEGAAKSPVLSYVTSSLEGLATIRSSRGQTTVSRRFDSRQDVHTRAHFLNIAVSCAFGLWLDLISVIFVAFVTLNCVAYRDDISAGNIGLAITQILMLCGMLQRGIRQASESVTQMTSVERILQFTELDQEENSDESKFTKPPSEWPDQGKIEFRNYTLKYTENDLNPVLKNVNIIVQPGTKIGIVGRTGAGKSSLISALFRLDRGEGEILVDELNIHDLSLHELRKRLAIIPQEPVLFSASLRDNLDPYHEFEDARLWAALEDVQLHKAFVPLDHPIECSGRNLSAGQRQLLCLARAIVKKTRILVLDEATANVDPATDSLIRETIHAKFQNCTVLTVAHRLESVIDNDKIVVIDNGEIIEFDHPHNLLEKENGALASMAKEAGDAMLEHYKKVAEETFDKLKNQASIAISVNENITLEESEHNTTKHELSETEVTVEINQTESPETAIEDSQTLAFENTELLSSENTNQDSHLSTPETAELESFVSTPENAIIYSNVLASENVKDIKQSILETTNVNSSSLTPQDKIKERIISISDNGESEERANANGLLKNNEIIETINSSIEKP